MSARAGDRIVVGVCAHFVPYLEGRLPDAVELRVFANQPEAVAGAKGLEVAWLDFFDWAPREPVYAAATDLKWASTLAAGVDAFPLALLREKGIRFTNGAGINSTVVAEYAVLGMLVAAKRFDEVMRAHDRGEWLAQAPGRIELEGSRALIVGYGAIGQAVARRLRAFDTAVDAVRRHPTKAGGELGPTEWQAKVGDYDFVVLAAPAEAGAPPMIDAAVLAAMKPTAWIVNVGRGTLIDREALLDALQREAIGGVFLDVTDPEPLPPGDPLWKMPNAIISAHLSGRSQRDILRRSAEFFLGNLQRYVAGEPLLNELDLARGY
jgi:phosphoglycerate dehydrogenase-like enzyme